MSVQDAKQYIDSQKQGWVGYLTVQAFTLVNFAMGMPAIHLTPAETFEQNEWSQTIATLDQIFASPEAEVNQKFVAAYKVYFEKARRSKRCETLYTQVAEKLYEKSIAEIEEFKKPEDVHAPLQENVKESGDGVGPKGREEVKQDKAGTQEVVSDPLPAHEIEVQDSHRPPDESVVNEEQLDAAHDKEDEDADSLALRAEPEDEKEQTEGITDVARSDTPDVEPEPGIIRTIALGAGQLGSYIYNLPGQLRQHPPQPLASAANEQAAGSPGAITDPDSPVVVQDPLSSSGSEATEPALDERPKKRDEDAAAQDLQHEPKDEKESADAIKDVAKPKMPHAGPGIVRSIFSGAGHFGNFLYSLPNQLRVIPQQRLPSLAPGANGQVASTGPLLPPVNLDRDSHSSARDRLSSSDSEATDPEIELSEKPIVKTTSHNEGKLEQSLEKKQYEMINVRTVEEAVLCLNKIPAADFTLFLTKAKITGELFKKKMKLILSKLSEEKRKALGMGILATQDKWGLSLIFIYDAFVLDDKAILSIEELLKSVADQKRYDTIVAHDARQGSLLQRIIMRMEWGVLQGLPEADRIKLLTERDSTGNSILEEVLLKPEQWGFILKNITSEEERLRIVQAAVTRTSASILSKAIDDFERSKQLLRVFASDEKKFTLVTTEINDRSILSVSMLRPWEEFKQILELFNPSIRFKLLVAKAHDGKSYLDTRTTITVQFVLEVLKLVQENADRITLLRMLFGNLLAVDKTPLYVELIKILTKEECRQLCDEKDILDKIPPEIKQPYIQELHQKAEIELPIDDTEDNDEEKLPTNYAFVFQCIAGVTAVAATVGLVLALVVLNSPTIAIACGVTAAVALGVGLYCFFSRRKAPPAKDEPEIEEQQRPEH